METEELIDMFWNIVCIVFITALLTHSVVTLAKTFTVTYEFNQSLTKRYLSGGSAISPFPLPAGLQTKLDPSNAGSPDE